MSFQVLVVAALGVRYVASVRIQMEQATYDSFNHTSKIVPKDTRGLISSSCNGLPALCYAESRTSTARLDEGDRILAL